MGLFLEKIQEFKEYPSRGCVLISPLKGSDRQKNLSKMSFLESIFERSFVFFPLYEKLKTIEGKTSIFPIFALPVIHGTRRLKL